MEKSFRAILFERMNAAPPAPAEPLPHPAPSFEATFSVRPITSKPRHAYALEAARSRAARAQVKPEVLVRADQLNAADRADLEGLLGLGAIELAPGLSPARLKTAFRRLARVLHPDVNAGGGHEAFLELERRYRRLTARVKTYQT